MEIFIIKSVGEVSESVSVSGVKSVKDAIDLYKEMGNSAVCNPDIKQHTEVVLDYGSVAVGGMSKELGNLMQGKGLQLDEFFIQTKYRETIQELKSRYKSSCGGDTNILECASGEFSVDCVKKLHQALGLIS